MPSGRKGRGPRHRKQKLEELFDYDEDSNLSHGPDPTPSPWAMELLPPHVEGPPVLKQDAVSVESLPRGINRKEASVKALRVQLPPPSKRKKGATRRTASDTDVANSATATSLDRWDGGDLQVDEILPYFYPSRGELEVASYELKNSNDKVEVLANGTGSKDSKSDGNMEMRKWKSHPEVAAGNRSSPVIDAFGPRQQAEASPRNSNMHTKHNATHQKGLSELVECNETAPSVDMNASKGLKLGSSALERVESNFPIGWSSKRVEKESGAAAQLSHTFETDAFKDEPEWKRGKANDLGLSSSPKLHISRPKRSEGSQMSQRFGDLVQIVSRDDAEVLEKPQHAAGKGTDWALQEDNRNPELEKELENRIRRRREESREESGEKEKWREYEKEKSIRRHHHQKEERYKEESRHREEKNQEEKPKEDGGKAEKGRIDSRQKDEKYKENRYMESKLKEEKQKTERNRHLPCRDDKECKENRKVDRDKEQRSIDGRLRGDRHKVEKEKDNRQKEDRDAKQEEDSFRDGRCRVDKDKEQKLKDEKVRDYRNKEQRLRDDHFERHKEENSWNARFQDEKEKEVRPRDKVDRAKDRDKEERLETIKEGKVRDERGKNPIKEALKDEKGSHGKKKGEGEQENINRTGKLQDKRQRIDKQQDGRDKDEREKVASRCRDDREGESRQREAISKEEKLQDYKDGDESQGVDHRQRSKGEKVAMDRLVDFREKADREKGDGERPVDVNGSGDKEAKQAEVHGKSREVLDGRKEDDKQGDGWWTKDIGHFDMDRDFCLSQDELGIQSKDLPDQLQVRKAREREARGDRKVVEKLTVQEGDRRGTKASKDDTQDRERAFSVVASSGAMVAHKSERRLKRTRDVGAVDSAITEKSHERSRGKHAEVENDLPLDNYKVLHCNHEDRLSPYDAPPRSPSPSLPDGNLPPSSEKPAHRSKFETSISVSSSSGTQWARERIRHMIEQTDQIKQHHDLEEEVKSWDPRGTNQDSDDGRGWSVSPNKNWDAFSSLPPDSGKEEYRRGLMRGQEGGDASEREHHRFSQSGGPSKNRRVDGGPRERKEWRFQGSQMKRAPMCGPMVRPQVQARLLPPPPPFRPGIDNPAVIGARSSNFDEGPGSRESGRYDRKLGVAFKRSEMGGLGEMWKGVGVSMGMGIENWNVQNPGLGPGNMFSPFAHIGGHPSAGFLGMAQHFPVPPLYGSGSAMPSSDMGFGGGTRYHAGDAGVRFSHGPYHGPVMGWQRPPEPNENRLPLVDTWEGQGQYIDVRHGFGYLEWDQGGKGMTGGDPWPGQAGDASTGLNPPCFQREASCEGNFPGEASTFYKDIDQKIEDPSQEIPDTTDPQTASPADPADVMMREVPQVESKATVQSKARLTRILLNLDVSAKLASNDLYKQYLSLLPASEVKIREMLVLKQGDASHGPIEEDLEFEVDSEAQELLSTPGLYADLLPQLSNNAFEKAVAIYHRPIQDTSVQKSVFGSFILPVDSSLIKTPSLGADLGTVRVGQLEAFGDQSCSSNGFDGPLSARKESLIRASRLMVDTLQDGTERVQDNQGSSLMHDEFSMGVEINPRSKQEGIAEVSFNQGGYGGTLGDEDIAINVDMVAYQMPSAGVGNCNIGLDIPVAEANVELSAIAELQAREDGNAQQMEVVRLDCKGGDEWPTGRDDSMLVEHCSEAFKEGWRKQPNEAAKKREDGVGSASQSFVSNARPEWQIVLEPELKIDEVKINSRPQQSSENGYENTH